MEGVVAVRAHTQPISQGIGGLGDRICESPKAGPAGPAVVSDIFLGEIEFVRRGGPMRCAGPLGGPEGCWHVLAASTGMKGLG